MENLVIGVLGGMGTYATIHLFRQYAQVFPAVREWERPRIILDNRCTMPSRARAYLYGENAERLVLEMTESLTGLLSAGCTRLLLGCNTAHLFLPQIYEREPALREAVLDAVENCAEVLTRDGEKEVFLLASEGTIDSGVYARTLAKKGIRCLSPGREEYTVLRGLIEAVKQNVYTEETKETFLRLVNAHPACILGCTELPVLAERYQELVTCRKLYDPLLLALLKLKEEYGKGAKMSAKRSRSDL